MLEHLDTAEKTIPEILRTHFTYQEEIKIVTKTILSNGIGGNKIALPWLIDTMI